MWKTEIWLHLWICSDSSMFDYHRLSQCWFWFSYVTRYYIEGQAYYDHDTTLLIHRLRQLPAAKDTKDAGDISKVPLTSELRLLDPSGGWIVQAAVEISDANIQELKDRATRQLLTWKDTLRQSVNLAPADRLALDTRIPMPVRRIWDMLLRSTLHRWWREQMLSRQCYAVPSSGNWK